MSVLPGNPTALAQRAAGYVDSARLILQAAEDLRSLAVDGKSKALAGIRSKGLETATQLDDAHTRYSGTAAALQVYSVKLKSAQDKADQADQQRARSQGQASEAKNQTDSYRQRYQTLEGSGAPVGSIEAAKQDWLDSGRAERALQASAAEATSVIESARQDVERAAQDAIAAIDNAIARTNDSAWDKVKKFFEDVGEFLAGIAKWVGEVLKKVLDAIVAAIEFVFKVLKVALLIIASIAAIVLLLATVLLTLPLTLPLIVIALLTDDMLLRRRLLLLVIGLILPGLAAFVMWRIFDNATAPVNVRPRDLEGPKKGTQFGTGGENQEMDLLGGAKRVDDGSSPNESLIEVMVVRGEDGVERAVISISSTLDWQYLGKLVEKEYGLDLGALGDFDSNMLLQLFPKIRGQYERAIKEAVEMAGLPPGIPIAIVGFSQGGIMAQQIAANNSGMWGGYNFQDVIAIGSPTDGPSANPNVNTVVIQDNTDPVAKSSGDIGNKVNSSDGFTVIRRDNDASGPNGIGAHDQVNYQGIVTDLKTSSKPEDVADYDAYKQISGKYSGTVVSQKTYSATE